MAVSELARHIGVSPGHILVVGDGHNDISMMQPHVARWTSCPVNAAPEVLETVQATGGHIASGRSLAGVLEILHAYEEGKLNSQLPPQYASSQDTAGGSGVRPRHPGAPRFGLRGWLIVAGTVMIVILVLASFGLLPFGQGLVQRYHRFIDALIRLFRG